jgi:hypothetical protein
MSLLLKLIDKTEAGSHRVHGSQKSPHRGISSLEYPTKNRHAPVVREAQTDSFAARLEMLVDPVGLSTAFANGHAAPVRLTPPHSTRGSKEIRAPIAQRASILQSGRST